MLEISIRPCTKAEAMYTFTQSCQIQGQTGCIGHLRADMDTNGEGFFSSWEDHRGYLKTDIFKAEFDEVINRLRFGAGDENGIRHEDEDTFLKNRSTLARYCYSHPSARMEGEDDNYGFRVDTDAYTYMARLSPLVGTYNMYMYAYRRDWLDQHLKNAERGIRFIDTNYNTLFRVPDGGKVRVTYCDGEVRDVVCRYIDEYHLEFGGGSCNLFHICELAEKLEKNGHKIEQLSKMPDTKDKEKAK